MEDRLIYKVYELKGMIGSFINVAQHHDQVNYPIIKNIEQVVNDMINLVTQMNQEPPKKVVSYYSNPILKKSSGFHSKV